MTLIKPYTLPFDDTSNKILDIEVGISFSRKMDFDQISS